MRHSPRKRQKAHENKNHATIHAPPATSDMQTCCCLAGSKVRTLIERKKTYGRFARLVTNTDRSSLPRSFRDFHCLPFLCKNALNVCLLEVIPPDGDLGGRVLV
mmetsp:Transcript_30687/g.60395  ORF Transcript_30687/g.60395 Transcript_30687/m.60395 type:complete len:104 (-) Transcript_30687:1377-1688(-)